MPESGAVEQRSSDQAKDPAQDVERRKRTDKPHWLTFLDTFARIVLAGAGVFWAVTSFKLQHTQNERTLAMQIETQRAALKSQREVAEGQLAASLLQYTKCDGREQKLMAMLILNDVSPRSAVAVSNALLKCEQSPSKLAAAEKLALEISLRELKADFLRQLSLARQYRRYGLQGQATEEYERAYNILPTELKTRVDHEAATKGRRANENGQYAEAADWFETAFRRVETDQ